MWTLNWYIEGGASEIIYRFTPKDEVIGIIDELSEVYGVIENENYILGVIDIQDEIFGTVDQEGVIGQIEYIEEKKGDKSWQ